MITYVYLHLQEVLPFKHNLLLCEHPPSDEDKEYPCVCDVLQLVLSGCSGYTNDSFLQYKKWEWLNTILKCKFNVNPLSTSQHF